MNDRDPKQEAPRRIRRREFLAWGSAFVVSPLLSGTTSAASRRSDPARREPAAEAGNGPLSIGYWRGSQNLPSLSPLGRPIGASGDAGGPIALADLPHDAPFLPDLIAADQLPEADPRFARGGARVTICGMFPSKTAMAWEGFSSVAIDVDFQPFHAAKYRAWSFHNAGAGRASVPCSFTVPIDASSGLKFSVEIGEGADPNRIAARLAASGGGQGPKLRRGVYVIALRGAQSGSPVAWSEYQLRSAEPANQGWKTRLFRLDRRRKELTPADFPCVLLFVDHGKASPAILA